MLPLDKLEQLTKRYSELEELMCRPDVLGDRNQLSKVTKERSDLQPLIAAFNRYRDVEKKLKEDQEALADPDLRELAEMEIPELTEEKGKLEKEIQFLLLPADPNDKKNVILEIRAGTGGDDATQEKGPRAFPDRLLRGPDPRAARNRGGVVRA